METDFSIPNRLKIKTKLYPNPDDADVTKTMIELNDSWIIYGLKNPYDVVNLWTYKVYKLSEYLMVHLSNSLTIPSVHHQVLESFIYPKD